jgi:hypothetical protein
MRDPGASRVGKVMALGAVGIALVGDAWFLEQARKSPLRRRQSGVFRNVMPDLA